MRKEKEIALQKDIFKDALKELKKWFKDAFKKLREGFKVLSLSKKDKEIMEVTNAVLEHMMLKETVIGSAVHILSQEFPEKFPDGIDKFSITHQGNNILCRGKFRIKKERESHKIKMVVNGTPTIWNITLEKTNEKIE